MMKEGFGLFILSEVMFFVAGFGAFFHCSLAPPVELGCVGPSNCIDLISTGGVPGFNTVLLLSSGATVTLCHHCLMCSRYKHSFSSLQATIWLAGIFTFGQGYEYQTTGLNISDGNAGSTFFLATGFHGIHVLIGTIFLTISMVRQLYYHYSSMHLFGFEAASWYFHFVDVVFDGPCLANANLRMSGSSPLLTRLIEHDRLVNIVLQQQNQSNMIGLPLLGLLFFISCLAETSRVPFDLAEAETELIAGFHVELAGIGFTLFFLAEYANIVAVALLTTTLFVGGGCDYAQITRVRIGRIVFLGCIKAGNVFCSFEE